jgi:PhzF family phenazine biosynthesis protein
MDHRARASPALNEKGWRMRQWMIDAFAEGPFKGNPACVVEPFDAWPDDGWMQSLAAENNQAETAFLRRTGEASLFDLRWFTPATEVKLCGHATLASGHVILSELGVDGSEVGFDTQSGRLTVRRATQGYEMDFPADPPHPIEEPENLAFAIGAAPVEVWSGQYVVAVLKDETAVHRAAPDLAAIKEMTFFALRAGAGMLGITALADPGAPYDVVSRFFAPGAGIPEDPATGSLHCMLSPLFSQKLGRETLRFRQAFPGRGGDLECERRGERVLLRGSAVTVVEGRLRV